MARAEVTLLRVDDGAGEATRVQVPAILSVNLTIATARVTSKPTRREGCASTVETWLEHAVAAPVSTLLIAVVALLVAILYAVAADHRLTNGSLVFSIAALTGVSHSLGTSVLADELLAVVLLVSCAAIPKGYVVARLF